MKKIEEKLTLKRMKEEEKQRIEALAADERFKEEEKLRIEREKQEQIIFELKEKQRKMQADYDPELDIPLISSSEMTTQQIIQVMNSKQSQRRKFMLREITSEITEGIQNERKFDLIGQGFFVLMNQMMMKEIEKWRKRREKRERREKIREINKNGAKSGNFDQEYEKLIYDSCDDEDDEDEDEKEERIQKENKQRKEEEQKKIDNEIKKKQSELEQKKLTREQKLLKKKKEQEEKLNTDEHARKVHEEKKRIEQMYKDMDIEEKKKKQEQEQKEKEFKQFEQRKYDLQQEIKQRIKGGENLDFDEEIQKIDEMLENERKIQQEKDLQQKERIQKENKEKQEKIREDKIKLELEEFEKQRKKQQEEEEEEELKRIDVIETVCICLISLLFENQAAVIAAFSAQIPQTLLLLYTEKMLMKKYIEERMMNEKIKAIPVMNDKLNDKLKLTRTLSSSNSNIVSLELDDFGQQ
ncbi:MAG: hypothetical protein EZS28_002236 [Streblomastix strix]|uniref:Uncharacterized protein n=1 Tax=Streblomastix strix TaxID=222440 RepID=A0A5J4X4S3_9EUKA|nr:MAG: hypothetical protein EZS28_002236 [Streblomastix strix]